MLLEELLGNGIRLSIATKSDLVLRDVDLIKTFPGSRVSFSINTLDEGFRREMDCTEDNRMADFGEPPIVVNYFYHEQVKKSARV